VEEFHQLPRSGLVILQQQPWCSSLEQHHDALLSEALLDDQEACAGCKLLRIRFYDACTPGNLAQGFVMRFEILDDSTINIRLNSNNYPWEAYRCGVE